MNAKIKFGIKRVWKDVFKVKEFSTLDELLQWCKEQNEEIIIDVNPTIYDKDKIKNYDISLEIYDGYRE